MIGREGVVREMVESVWRLVTGCNTGKPEPANRNWLVLTSGCFRLPSRLSSSLFLDQLDQPTFKHS